MKFEVGKKYTVFDISNFMSCTTKNEIVIKDEDERGTIFALKGKRKRFYTRVNDSTVVFEGHDLEIIPDSEFVIECENGMTSRRYCGNALLNFVGTIEFVKNWIENKNLNEELDKSLVVAKPNPADDKSEFMVYPELYVEGNHAVAERIIKKQLVIA